MLYDIITLFPDASMYIGTLLTFGFSMLLLGMQAAAALIVGDAINTNLLETHIPQYELIQEECAHPDGIVPINPLEEARAARMEAEALMQRINKKYKWQLLKIQTHQVLAMAEIAEVKADLFMEMKQQDTWMHPSTLAYNACSDWLDNWYVQDELSQIPINY